MMILGMRSAGINGFAFLLLLMMFVPCVAEEPRRDAVDAATEITLGGRSYRVALVFQDDFNSLDNWVVETRGSAQIRDSRLLLDCIREGERPGGTAWCRQPFQGNTLVTYDVRTFQGQDNINLFAYAQLRDDGQDELLRTAAQRDGEYGLYHSFQNYIVTYLKDKEHEGMWRIRFRKDPGFHLLAEKRISQNVPPGTLQRVAYAFEDDGWMRLFVDGQLVQEYRDASGAYRDGYHGLRTYNSRLEYDHFRVYRIESVTPDAAGER